jgi:hypothetical protein
MMMLRLAESLGLPLGLDGFADYGRAVEADELKRNFTEDQLVELALVVSMANFTNRFNNGLRIEPDLG